MKETHKIPERLKITESELFNKQLYSGVINSDAIIILKI